jgi:hypothetical protein
MDALFLLLRELPVNKQEENMDKLSPGTKGALNELIVTTDLLSKGYEVFRSVSPSTSCDLVAQKFGILTRIEVRSGYMTDSGKLTFKYDLVDYKHSDTIAVVLNTGDIHYLSPEEAKTNKLTSNRPNSFILEATAVV